MRLQGPHRGECQIICGDSRIELGHLRDQIDLIVTSPPYADARAKHYDSIHPDQFCKWFLTFHKPLFEALKPSGSLVLNIKDKIVNGVRHRFVWNTIDELCRNGWFAIDDYIWRKTNPMPGFWPTRLRDGWEYCFHLAKCRTPYINQDAVRIPVGHWVESRLAKLGVNDLARHNSVNRSGFGRDLSRWVGKQTVLPSNVISAALVGKNKGHPSVFPVDIPEFFIRLLCPPDGFVADPFAGSGTTGIAALALGRRCVLIDNNEKFCDVARDRIKKEANARDEEVTTVSLREATYTPEIPQKTEEQIRFFEDSPDFAANGKKAAKKQRRRTP